MSAAARILDRADRPKQTRPGSYMFGCPCCKSRQGRPVSLRELDDGRVLLHAFCGCDTEAVLTTLGLSMMDLFDKPLGHHFNPSHSRIPARDLLTLIAHEATTVAVIASDLSTGRRADDATYQRLANACSRIMEAKIHAIG